MRPVLSEEIFVNVVAKLGFAARDECGSSALRKNAPSAKARAASRRHRGLPLRRLGRVIFSVAQRASPNIERRAILEAEARRVRENVGDER
jgi:hypothetical protein